MEPTSHQTKERRWKTFREFPFSQRTLNFFANAEICSVEQFTNMNIQQLMKYRNVGRVAANEIRRALARMNLSLEGEPYSPLELYEPDDLKVRLKAMEQKRDEISNQIRQLKLQITALKPVVKRPPKNP